jgi:hypothetical protein
MEGFERIGQALFNLSESDADYMFGEMDTDIIKEAFLDLVNEKDIALFGELMCLNPRALWRQCIEIAATRAGINDSSKIEIDDNYCDAGVRCYSKEVEDFEECAHTFYMLTGFELEEV